LYNKASEVTVYGVSIAAWGISHVKIGSYPAEEIVNNQSIYLADMTMF
jgi:hypothetical protein